MFTKYSSFRKLSIHFHNLRHSHGITLSHDIYNQQLEYFLTNPTERAATKMMENSKKYIYTKVLTQLQKLWTEYVN